MIQKPITEEIANFNEIRDFILGAIFIILIFSIVYAYLKPHQLHKRRLLSTLLLKTTYLFYLLVLLIIVYLSALVKGGLLEVFKEIEFFAFLIVLFVPNIAILARKMGHFSKKRENYNWFFIVVNVLSTLAILVMFFV
jgi:hypothetical protein